MKKNRNKIMSAILTGAFFLVFWLFLYKAYVIPAVAKPAALLEKKSTEKRMELADGREVVQEFAIAESSFEQVGIRFEPENGTGPYRVMIRLEEKEGEVIQEWQVDSSLLSPHDYTPLGLKEPVKNAGGKEYRICVRTEGLEDGRLSVYLAKKEEESGLSVNGVQKKRDLSFIVRGGRAWGIRTMFLLLGGGFFLLLGAIFLGIFREWSIQRMFLPVGLILGILYMTGIPLMAGPDETRHGATIYSYSNQLMGLPGVDQEGYVPARKEDEPGRYGQERIPTRDSLLKGFEGLGNREIDQREGRLRAPLAVPAILYLPQILGVTLARLLNLNGIWLYYLGRLFGLLAYLGITCLAIRLIPFGKRMLFFTACLPMCMQQAAVLTYDTAILSCAFLMTAHILYLAYEKQEVRVWDWIPSMLCMAVMLPGKIVYVFLALLLLLIPGEKYRFPLGKWLGMGAALLGGLAALVAVKATGAVNILSRQSWTVPWGDEPAYTLSYVLEKPLETLGVFWNSLVELGKDYLGTMIGRYLCTYFDIRIAYWILWGFLLILILAALRSQKEENVFSAGQRGLFVLIFAGTAGAACLSMLLAYTSVYSPVLQGVQGRYFLPALPVLLLIFRVRKPVFKEAYNGILVWAMGLLQILTLSTVFFTIISR